MIVVVSFPQAVLDHGIHHLGVAHAGAVTAGRNGIRRCGHVLGTAADNDVGVTCLDGASTFDDGLHAGTTHHANRVGGNGEGQAGLDAHLTGNVLTLSSRQDATEHQFIHLLGLDAGAVQGFLDHDGTQIGSGNILQGTTKGTDCGSAAIDNINFRHVRYLLKDLVVSVYSQFI